MFRAVKLIHTSNCIEADILSPKSNIQKEMFRAITSFFTPRIGSHSDFIPLQREADILCQKQTFVFSKFENSK